MNIRERPPCRRQIEKLLELKHCSLSDLHKYAVLGNGARKQLQLMRYESGERN